MSNEKPQLQLSLAQECCRELNLARRNYRLAVRWYREVLCYIGTVRGDEWKQEDEESWLAEDSQFAYNEVISDIKKYRTSINSLTKKWNELKEHDDAK